MLKGYAVRWMASLLRRWGYTVTYQTPTVLQAEHILDPRQLELDRGGSIALIQACKRQLALAIADKIAEGVTFDAMRDKFRDRSSIRARFEYYPVVGR